MNPISTSEVKQERARVVLTYRGFGALVGPQDPPRCLGPNRTPTIALRQMDETIEFEDGETEKEAI